MKSQTNTPKQDLIILLFSIITNKGGEAGAGWLLDAACTLVPYGLSAPQNATKKQLSSFSSGDLGEMLLQIVAEAYAHCFPRNTPLQELPCGAELLQSLNT